MLLLCLLKLLGVISWGFFWMIMAACSAILEDWILSSVPLERCLEMVNEHHVQCEAQVWGGNLGFGKPWHRLLCLDRPGGLDTPATSICNDFSLIHNVETKNHLALNFKPLPALPWEWAFLANPKFLNITSPITFSQVSIYAGLAFPIHGAGTGLRLNALQVAGGALGSLAKLVPDGHTVWVITSAH